MANGNRSACRLVVLHTRTGRKSGVSSFYYGRDGYSRPGSPDKREQKRGNRPLEARDFSHGAFTVSMATAKCVTACDYVGLVSGNQEPDKFSRAGFHATRSERVDAPLIDELPMALECEVISYDPESCRLVGRIVNVSADESVLGEDGRVDVSELQPITYDALNHHYLVLGEKVGGAFCEGRVLMEKK